MAIPRRRRRRRRPPAVVAVTSRAIMITAVRRIFLPLVALPLWRLGLFFHLTLFAAAIFVRLRRVRFRVGIGTASAVLLPHGEVVLTAV